MVITRYYELLFDGNYGVIMHSKSHEDRLKEEDKRISEYTSNTFKNKNTKKAEKVEGK